MRVLNEILQWKKENSISEENQVFEDFEDVLKEETPGGNGETQTINKATLTKPSIINEAEEIISKMNNKCPDQSGMIFYTYRCLNSAFS